MAELITWRHAYDDYAVKVGIRMTSICSSAIANASWVPTTAQNVSDMSLKNMPSHAFPGAESTLGESLASYANGASARSLQTVSRRFALFSIFLRLGEQIIAKVAR